MTQPIINIKPLIIAFCFGATSALTINYLMTDDLDKSQQIALLEKKIKSLELSLGDTEVALKNARQLALQTKTRADIPDNTHAINNNSIQQNTDMSNAPLTNEIASNSIDTLKSFETTLINDPNSLSEKVASLLSENPTKEKIAIVSKSIVDMANNPTSLPDYALQSIYREQTDPDLKRVVAQVLSQRGNNALMDSQIAEAQIHLKSDQPTDRQQALGNLAKTHSSYAADAIAPLLQDPDINVKLDALLALRATGNQTHIHLAEKLLNDPEPAVSSLANDVVGSLRNLSDSARTRLTLADIASELPQIEN